MTPSRNITETAIAGKYSRLFITGEGATQIYPINASSWTMNAKRSNYVTTSADNFGFAHGGMSFIETDLEFNVPYSVARTELLIGHAPKWAWFRQPYIFQAWLVHPDFGVMSPEMQLARFLCVAETEGYPVHVEVNGVDMMRITAKARGPVYHPFEEAPTPSTLLDWYNTSYGTNYVC